MGIKGIYKEIGPGERVSLCKLATEHFEQTQRPFRLAIDISIWQFQVQAAKGGSNPAIRTLFYRLARLLGSAIEPIFVFDGPNKPVFKRNKRSGRGDGVATAMGKRVIRLFGFATHDAPGEAEAECALLQQHGIVDAVLSEDVDTIMFGCGKTLRNWSAEGTKGSKTPTHVTIYDAAKVAAGASGLDREGMVLVALMNGGDYLPEGVPGCGVKVACEAARAGFGRDLCKIKKSDTDALAAWKERLLHELRTNESRYFRTKHKALEIPDTFPNMDVLRYYTHPVVSRQENLERIKQKFLASRQVDVIGLRQFVAETFDWTNKIGAIKFIRVISASLLIQRLVRRCGTAEVEEGDLDLKQNQELVFVKSVTKRREHFSTDTTPELRVSYIPVDVVGLDLDEEPEDEVEEYGRQGLALNSDDEFDGEADEESEQSKGAAAKKSFDPLTADLIWVPESILEMSLPLTVSNWRDKQRAKELKAAAPKAKRATARSKKTDMPVGALDKFVKVTKAVGSTKPTSSREPSLSSQPPRSSAPPTLSAPVDALNQDSTLPSLTRLKPKDIAPKQAPGGVRGKQAKKLVGSKATSNKPSAGVNPWTIASSQASPKSSKTSKSTATSSFTSSIVNSSQEPILISSSPAGPTQTPSPVRSIDPANQGTPTRRGKRLSSPSIENLDVPDPASPAFLLASTAGSQQCTNPPSAHTSPEPIRRARPFKRTKSGAENESTTIVETTTTSIKTQMSIKSSTQAHRKTSTQANIKSFGRVTRNNPLATLAAKQPQLTIPIDPFASDEEDDGGGLPLSLAPRGPLRGNIEMESSIPADDKPALRGGYFSDDDDPFDPVTSSSVPTRSSSSILQSRRTSPLSNLPIKESSVPNKSNEEIQPISKSRPETAKLAIPPSISAGVDFFNEVEVTREEARAANKTLIGVRSGGKNWRRSEISIVDLTGED